MPLKSLSAQFTAAVETSNRFEVLFIYHQERMHKDMAKRISWFPDPELESEMLTWRSRYRAAKEVVERLRNQIERQEKIEATRYAA